MRIFHSLFAAAALFAAATITPLAAEASSRVSTSDFPSLAYHIDALDHLVEFKAAPADQVIALSPDLSPAVTAQNGANTSQGASMRVHRKLVASYLINVDRLTHAPPQGVVAPVPIRV